jgi:hypothetical protein
MPKSTEEGGFNKGGIDDMAAALARGEKPEVNEAKKTTKSKATKDESEEDESEESEEEEPEDESEESEDEESESDDPKALKAELTKAKKALKRANTQAAKLRNENKDVKAKQSTVADLQHELNVRDAIELLREEGVQGSKSRLRRVVKMLDSVDPQDVEDAVDQLKEDDPDLFTVEEKPKKRVRKAPPKSGPAGGDESVRRGGGRGNLSPTSVAMLRGGR